MTPARPMAGRSSIGNRPLSAWALGAASGLFVSLAILKFGNPIILSHMIEAPLNLWELFFHAWPPIWGFVFLGMLVIFGVFWVLAFPPACQPDLPKPKWLFVLPLVWLMWQWISVPFSINPQTSLITAAHFSACAVCFYFGVFVLSRVDPLLPFWGLMLPGFLYMIWMGFEQHYGGLEATREYIYSQPDWESLPPELLQKMSSKRIFSTLVYPNAFAGAILLLLPAMLTALWALTERRLTAASRWVIVGVVAYGGLACLVWSGSKAGWLVGLLMGLILLLRQPFPQKLKRAVVWALALGGLAAFFIQFSGYFQRGAPSVGARFDYWTAAVKTATSHPLFGTGPGTFAKAYQKIKPREAEMTKLAHNDYLEQASDSGLAGFLSYSVFIFGSMAVLYRKSAESQEIWVFPVWLGLLGWTVQSGVEFFLYIPALAWSAFLLLGWLSGRPERWKP